jgi:hypothetical protein
MVAILVRVLACATCVKSSIPDMSGMKVSKIRQQRSNFTTLLYVQPSSVKAYILSFSILDL